MHENELVNVTHFHKNRFALRLVLTQRLTRTQKWAIESCAWYCRREESLQSYLLLMRDVLSSFVVAKLKAEAAEVELVAELESAQMVNCNTSDPDTNVPGKDEWPRGSKLELR